MPDLLEVLLLTIIAWAWFVVIRGYLRRWRRERLAAAALTGLLADHLDHAEECETGETCPEAVARLAVQHADAVLRRLETTDAP